MRQQTGKVTAQLKLKTLNDNPYIKLPLQEILVREWIVLPVLCFEQHRRLYDLQGMPLPRRDLYTICLMCRYYVSFF
jgi:hypothetical protein